MLDIILYLVNSIPAILLIIILYKHHQEKLDRQSAEEWACEQKALLRRVENTFRQECKDIFKTALEKYLLSVHQANHTSLSDLYRRREFEVIDQYRADIDALKQRYTNNLNAQLTSFTTKRIADFPQSMVSEYETDIRNIADVFSSLGYTIRNVADNLREKKINL